MSPPTRGNSTFNLALAGEDEFLTVLGTSNRGLITFLMWKQSKSQSSFIYIYTLATLKVLFHKAEKNYKSEQFGEKL